MVELVKNEWSKNWWRHHAVGMSVAIASEVHSRHLNNFPHAIWRLTQLQFETATVLDFFVRRLHTSQSIDCCCVFLLNRWKLIILKNVEEHERVSLSPRDTTTLSNCKAMNIKKKKLIKESWNLNTWRDKNDAVQWSGCNGWYNRIRTIIWVIWLHLSYLKSTLIVIRWL